MADIAIKVENLGKLYHIGAKQEQYLTLRSALVSSIKGLTARRSSLRADRDTIWALKDVSFEVKQGEVVGVIGRNGAGKSTLLKVLSHITEPTKGRVSLYGRVGSLLEVGTGFHPELTGRDNIYLNGAILGMKRAEIERRFDEIVAFAEIEKFLDTPVKRYSSGMYVRLAFAVAAHLEPDILLVDEVLAVGDAEFQKKCLGKMSDVAKAGRTVLFVSHNMGAISNLCQRGILLVNGQLTMDALANEVITRYMNMGLDQYSVWQRNDKLIPEGAKHYLKSLEILSTKKESSNKFLFGESIILRCTVFSKKAEDIYLGIGIRDSFSNQIIHFSNIDHNAKLKAKTGTNIFNVKFDNILNKGDYFITVWIGDSHFIDQDYIRDCASFSSDTVNLGNNFFKGIVITNADWVQEAEPSKI